VDGSPFLNATIDGVPGSPDPGDLDAYWNGQVVLRARRNVADAVTTEILQVNFASSNAFQLERPGYLSRTSACQMSLCRSTSAK
jgi:hypothetical protein